MKKDLPEVFWAVPMNRSSNRYHLYRAGKAICGSPLAPSPGGPLRTVEKPPPHVVCRVCDSCTRDVEVGMRLFNKRTLRSAIVREVECGHVVLFTSGGRRSSCKSRATLWIDYEPY